MAEPIKLDMHKLFSNIIDDIVNNFAEAMTPPGGDVMATTANFYRGMRDVCDLKIQIADGFTQDRRVHPG